MNLLAYIITHKSVRKYKRDPVPGKILGQILEASFRASSSGNIQPYCIIVTKDYAHRKKLWELHEKQDMILQAPVLLTFCADWNRMNRWCRLNSANPGYDNFLCFLVGAGDAFIAAQNAAIAAECLGLGICYMGTTLNNAPDIAEFLNCPQGVVPVTTLVLGYSDETPEMKDRLPPEGIVHREKYNDFSKPAIRRIYRKKETEGWKRYMDLPGLKKKIEKSGVKNLAQVYTDVKYLKKANILSSLNFIKLLEKQQFMNHKKTSRPQRHIQSQQE